MPNIPVIGLVGGIGSGKSLVGSMLADLGCLVCHSDELARSALADPAVRGELVRWWGREVLDPSGAVDRRAVAGKVFADPAERKRLEALLHPRIESARRRTFAAAPPGTRALVIDAPLLLEVGLDRECDAIIYIDSLRVDRLRRLAETRGWDSAELERRESAQWPLDRKRAAAHHVLVNAGNQPALRSEVQKALEAAERTFRAAR
jgi:dephospho-CoA kinase